MKKSIENIQKELHNNTKQTHDLIHRLTVKVEELESQINSNAKSIKVRKRYAVRKTKEVDRRFDEIIIRLDKCLTLPKLLPLKSLSLIDANSAKSSPRSFGPDSGKDTQGD